MEKEKDVFVVGKLNLNGEKAPYIITKMEKPLLKQLLDLYVTNGYQEFYVQSHYGKRNSKWFKFPTGRYKEKLRVMSVKGDVEESEKIINGSIPEDVNQRQILQCEIVLDIDDKPYEENAVGCCKLLDALRCSYRKYNGNRSFHIHTMFYELLDFKARDRTTLKRLFMKQFQCFGIEMEKCYSK